MRRRDFEFILRIKKPNVRTCSAFLLRYFFTASPILNKYKNKKYVKSLR
jgi:hypothetical protein